MGDLRESLINVVTIDMPTLLLGVNRTEQHRWVTDSETIDIIRALARTRPDLSIAAIINRLGRRTARGHTWTAARIGILRHDVRSSTVSSRGFSTSPGTTGFSPSFVGLIARRPKARSNG